MSQKLKLSNILPLAFFVIALAFFFWVRDANATKPKPPPNPPQEQTQRQNQEQAQHQDQSQNQQASAESSSESHSQSSSDQSQSMGDMQNSQNITFTSPDDVTIRNTASANPPSVYGSHPCAVGGSAGIGIPAVNISGGRQKIDAECVRREESRLLHALGERELAVIHLCNAPTLVESLGVACGPSVTQEELRRRIDFLLIERGKDSERCNTEKDRILEGCVK